MYLMTLFMAAWLAAPPTASDSVPRAALTRHGSPTTDDLHAIFFLDDAHGWIATHNTGRVLATSDGGRTWAVIASLEPGYLEWITFVDTHRGWACGEKGRLFATADGGHRWRQIRPDDPDIALSVVQFLDDRRGFTTGMRLSKRSHIVLVTEDGGATWRESESTDGARGATDAVTMTDASTALVGGFGAVFRTADGGNTWTRHDLTPRNVVRGLFAIDADTIWAVGHSGLVLVSEDAGETWRDGPNVARTMLRGVVFAGKMNGFIFGNGDEHSRSIWRTRDAGRTWSDVPGTFPDVHRAALTLERVWMVGEGGAIYSLVR